MEKYYEMFRDKNQRNKKEFFNSPDHSDQDSGDLEEVGGWVKRCDLCVLEKPVSFTKITQSLIY